MGERGNGLLKYADYIFGIPLSIISASFRSLSRKSGFSNRTGILCQGAIGDLLLASALANGIRRKYPESHIEVITSKANAGVIPLLADVNNGVSFPIGRLDKTISYMRGQKYDLLFDTSQWARLGNILCNLSGARQTIGFYTKGQHRSAGYDVAVEHRCDVHEISNFLALGKAVWHDFTGEPNLFVPVLNKSYEKMIYLHMWPAPGPGRRFKEWPENYWVNLAERLLEKGYNIGLTGSMNDYAPTERFLRKFFASSGRIISLAGKVDLFKLATIIKNAEAVISVNTGIMHLAALLNIPTIGLHGATNPDRWGPIGKKSVSVLPDSGQYGYLNLGFEYPANVSPAMHFLPVQKVLDALDTVLKN